jgi:hypothetical protein
MISCASMGKVRWGMTMVENVPEGLLSTKETHLPTKFQEARGMNEPTTTISGHYESKLMRIFVVMRCRFIAASLNSVEKQ